MGLKAAAEKANGFIEEHPKLCLFLCGGIMALYAFQLAEASAWFAKAFRECHRAELAADGARAASEALGG